VKREVKNKMSSIDKMLKRQREREQKEFEALQRSVWKLKPIEEQIGYELMVFLNRELPNVESHIARLHIYMLSSELQRKFKQLLIEKGLLQV
jgi:hypothetical protein